MDCNPKKKISVKKKRRWGPPPRAPQHVAIGHRLKLIRLSLGYRQEDLARKFGGITRHVIKLAENNFRHASHGLLMNYSDLAVVTVDWILHGRPVTAEDRSFLIRVRKMRLPKRVRR